MSVRQVVTPPLYSQDLLPYDDLRGGVIAAGRGVAALVRVDGLDIEMLSPAEKHAQVRALAELHDLREHPFQYYTRIRRRDLSPIMRTYDQGRLREANPQLRAQFFLDRDHIQEEAERAGVMERLNIVTLTTPIKQQAGMAGMSGSDELAAKRGAGAWERVKKQFIAFGWEQLRAVGMETPEEQEESRRARRGQSISDEMRRAVSDEARTFASRLSSLGLSAEVMSDAEVLRLLADQMGGGIAGMGRDGTAPAIWDEHPDYLQLGRRFVTVLFGSELPFEVYPGFLMSLVRLKDVEQLEISIHLLPIPDAVADRKLKAMERDVRWAKAEDDLNRKLDDVGEAAAAVRQMIAQRRGRAYIASMYVAVSASTLPQLREDLAKVYSVMQTMRLRPFVARLDQANAYASVLPIGYNKVPRAKLIARQVEQTATSAVTACLQPALISTFDHDDGIVLGTSVQDGSLVRVNPRRFGAGAGHETFIAMTGSGKTMDTIIEAVRQLMADPHYRIRYIDPQNGVAQFTRAIGGQSVDLNPRSGVIINCMDRTGPGKRPMLIAEKLSYLTGLFALMTRSELPAATESALGRALISLYHHFEDGENTTVLLARGIARLLDLSPEGERQTVLFTLQNHSADQVLQYLRQIAEGRADERRLEVAAEWAGVEGKRGTPTLGDLMPYLVAEGAAGLVEQLENYINPELFGASYNGRTNVNLKSRFVQFNVRDVPDAQKPVVMYMIMDYIWQEQVTSPYPATAVADEAGILFGESPAVGKYIATLYKRARALKLRVVTIDQNIGMFINTEIGRKIIDNSDIVKLAGQAGSGTNVADLKRQFGLTDGQISTLLTASKGELLILAGGKVIHSRYSISNQQLRLYDTMVEGREAEDARREAEAAAGSAIV